MARKSPQIQIQEIHGDHFPSVEAAQNSARSRIAFDLANILRGLLDTGALEIRDGYITPKA
ncbi:MAG: hypothetical protein ABI904_12850 [Chloroflexota bacterium]